MAYDTFSSNASPEYREAVLAVRKLAAKEGLGKARQAVASALSNPIREQFLTRTSARESNAVAYNRQRLMGMKIAQVGNADDHCCLWNRNGKHWAYISHPYVLETKDLREIVRRCDENNLNAQVRSDASWHFPLKTVAVIWTQDAWRIELV